MSLQRPSIRCGMRGVLGIVLLLLLASPILASPLRQNCATMGFSPTTVSDTQVGDIVTLQVPLDADGVTFNAAGFEVSFDQTLLQVVDAADNPASEIEPGDLPGTNVWNTASNTEGTIEFDQLILSGQTGGTFTVATIRFKVVAVSPAGSTQVTFVNGEGNTGVFWTPQGQQQSQQLLCEFPGSATITFARRLTVTADGAGTGQVTSDPAGINCGSECTAYYVKDTVVTLTAHPGVKSYFIDWGGDCTGTERTAQVTMDTDKTCSATFGYPVGGIVVPVDNLGLMAPWVGLAAPISLIALTVALLRRRRA